MCEDVGIEVAPLESAPPAAIVEGMADAAAESPIASMTSASLSIKCSSSIPMTSAPAAADPLPSLPCLLWINPGLSTVLWFCCFCPPWLFAFKLNEAGICCGPLLDDKATANLLYATNLESISFSSFLASFLRVSQDAALFPVTTAMMDS
eukprot:CAMPEP_0184696776 /NCGR_PEP_ID=MMETSP0313-20130426/3965_1 /TAXON_ID=2792 /ORGANISM="Porphyridium aerugineum, Strain SAG 1380-2" /LENGTH=149 /DNA_ID=CAMNT_0027155471 /DNA_START=220 /DNA_END=669 /DNA_ORIENTATION=-